MDWLNQLHQREKQPIQICLTPTSGIGEGCRAQCAY